jgi:hypothetical protein
MGVTCTGLTFAHTARRFALLICIASLTADWAQAAELNREDASAIREVVSQQLDAFKRDDAKGAFALATAGIRAKFGSPEVFMEMVRSGYPAVYRPKSVQFDPPEMVGGAVIQPVRLTDAEGRAWLALYPMLRLPDGTWRIDGCQLARLQGRET